MIEKHYKPSEIARILNLEVTCIRKMFEREPGVLIVEHPPQPGKRKRRTFRIPASVFERVYRRARVA